MFFIAQDSWTNLHPLPLGFLTGEMGVLYRGYYRDNEALSLVIFYYELYALKSFFTYRALIQGRGFEGSI